MCSGMCRCVGLCADVLRYVQMYIGMYRCVGVCGDV